MKRIHENIRNPDLKTDLIDDVSKGRSLSNSDASKVYPIDHEPGGGLIKNLVITSHGQYRMDLRSVTVDDLRKALSNHGKILQKLRSQKNPTYDRLMQEFKSGKLEWLDPQNNLFLALDVSRPPNAVLITTYWKGKSDPKAVKPEVCKI